METITLEQFINKYKNKFLDFDKNYGNQCVDLFRFYVKEVLDYPQPRGVVGAYQFFEDFEKDKILQAFFIKIKNSSFFMPRAGDVCIWNKGIGPYGHIAIATGKSTLWNFECFTQNDPPKAPCVLKTYKYKYFYGVLRRKDMLEEWVKANGNDDYITWLNHYKNQFKK